MLNCLRRLIGLKIITIETLGYGTEVLKVYSFHTPKESKDIIVKKLNCGSWKCIVKHPGVFKSNILNGYCNRQGVILDIDTKVLIL